MATDVGSWSDVLFLVYKSQNPQPQRNYTDKPLGLLSIGVLVIAMW